MNSFCLSYVSVCVCARTRLLSSVYVRIQKFHFSLHVSWTLFFFFAVWKRNCLDKSFTLFWVTETLGITWLLVESHQGYSLFFSVSNWK